MCFLQLADDAVRRSRPFADCERIAAKDVRNVGARQRICCGICHQHSELRSPDALFCRVNDHFRDLHTSRYHCDECQIKFAHMSDLERHLSSAKLGNCGFHFAHKDPCLGHHPLITSKGRTRGSHPDHDRIGFSFRILHWEHAQLVGFVNNIKRLREVELDLDGPRTDPLWRSSVAAKVTAASTMTTTGAVAVRYRGRSIHPHEGKQSYISTRVAAIIRC